MWKDERQSPQNLFLAITTYQSKINYKCYYMDQRNHQEFLKTSSEDLVALEVPAQASSFYIERTDQASNSK